MNSKNLAKDEEAGNNNYHKVLQEQKATYQSNI
jgi:hypothetical protein